MEQAELIPPVLYLACGHVGDDSFNPDRRTTEDGQVALLVYSALDRLVECCGPHQQWIVVPTSRLDEIGSFAPYDVILLDTEIPAELRREVTVDA